MEKIKFINKAIWCVITLLLFASPVASQGTSYDWKEKIQLYGHGFSAPTDFTDAEFDSIANMFKIFTVEKRHAYNSYGGSPSTERATIGTAANLRAINPDIKVLLYWNSVMNYETLYESNTEFGENEDWVHSIWNTGYEIYDLENIDCQDWWVNSIVKTIRDGDLDGVFLDAGPKVNASGLTDAYNVAVDRVRDSVGHDKIVIYNGFRAVNTTLQAGQDYIDHQSGVFIEFFLYSPCDSKDEISLLFDNLTEAYEDEKMIIPRGTPEHYMPGAEDPFLFHFASFLLFYGPNSYYSYSQSGYAVDEGMLDYYPEYYDIATGASISGPEKNGYVYTREFENISVEVDLENVTATITIKEVPVDTLPVDTVPIDTIPVDSVTTHSKMGRFPSSNEELKVYPNPIGNQFTVEAPTTGDMYEVYDISGRVVLRGIIEDTHCRIDARQLDFGVYLVKVNNKTKIIYKPNF